MNYVTSFYKRDGDCKTNWYTAPPNFLPVTVLTSLKNQCDGKNSCTITGLKIKLGDCQSKNASYLHVVYNPNTCGVFNNRNF